MTVYENAFFLLLDRCKSVDTTQYNAQNILYACPLHICYEFNTDNKSVY